jgi:uncharacterized delta-60 repeat protein
MTLDRPTLHLLAPITCLALAVGACSSSASSSPDAGDHETSGDSGARTGLPEAGRAASDAAHSHDSGRLAEGGSHADAASATPSFTIAATGTEVELTAGGSVSFKVTVDRGAGADGDIALTVSGLPAGVTAAPATIAAGSSVGTITLSGTGSAAQGGPVSMTVLGALADAKASAKAALFVRGAPGTLDLTFGTAGVAFQKRDALIGAVAIQPDGKIILGGSVFVGQTATEWISRVDEQLAPDPTFGTAGVVTLDFGTTGYQYIDDLFVEPSGDIVNLGAGYNPDFSPFPLLAARLTSNGALDTTFNTTGQVKLTFPGPAATEVGTDVSGGLLQADGKIVAFGGVPGFGSGPQIFTRLTTSGAADDTFGTAGIFEPAGSTGSVACGAVQADGTIVTAGFAYPDGMAIWQVQRLTTSGALDASYGTAGGTTTAFASDAYVSACALDSHGNLLVLGSVTVSGVATFAFERYTPAGIADPTFNHGIPLTVGVGAPGIGSPTRLLLDAEGRIVAVGSSTSAALTVMRVTADGVLDPTFGTAGVFLTNGGTAQVPGSQYTSAEGAIDARQRLLVVGSDTANGTTGMFAARVWL